MRVYSIVPRISSSADSRMSGIPVKTLDLVQSCPIWGGLASTSALMRRILGLRERWSHHTVMVSGPLTIEDVDRERTRPGICIRCCRRSSTSSASRRFFGA